MSGAGMGNGAAPLPGGIDLAETADGALRPCLPPGHDLPGWHRAVVDEIAAHLGPAHAAVFAEPVRGEGGWRWRTQGQAVREISELDASDRRALSAALTAILSDIRRLAESGAAPMVRAAWPALREVPGWESVLAVDGRPVLTAWGHRGAEGQIGPLAALDDGLPWLAPPRPAWSIYGVALASVAALALVLGLLLALLGHRLLPEPACAVAPGQLDLLAEQNRAIDRGNELRTLLATLDDEIGRRQLACPIPQRAARPAPERRADLPQEQWDRHDVSMLNGCWHSTTQMHLQRESDGLVHNVEEWKLCFDSHGQGQQTIRWTGGGGCQGPLRASFSDANLLRIEQPARCVGPEENVYRGVFECRRTSNSDAICELKQTEGNRVGTSQTGRFSR